MTKFLLVRDTREKVGFWDWNEDDYCQGCTVDTIKYGDYSIKGLEDLIFIERKKTTAEFANNCVEKRFNNLISAVKDKKYKFIIFEFDLEDILTYPINSGVPRWQFKKIRIKPPFLMAYIAKLMIDYNINIIYAGNKDRAESICYSLCKQIYKTEIKNV